MVKATVVNNSFSSGEVSPFVHQSGSDLKVYKGCLVHCHNYIPLRTRALMRRTGTRVYHVFDNPDYAHRLLTFIVDPRSCALVVLGVETLQIFLRQGDFFRQGECFDTPYSREDISDIRVAQHTDTMFFAHPHHPPHQLTITEDRWSFKPVDFVSTPQAPRQYVGRKKIDARLKTPFDNSKTSRTGIIAVEADRDVFKKGDVGRQLSLGWSPPAWKSSTWYSRNCVVICGGKLFKCVGEGQSQANTWQPNAQRRQEDGSVTWLFIKEAPELILKMEGSDQIFWAQGSINAFKTPRKVLLNVGEMFPLQDSNYTDYWSLGEWGEEEGYPPFVTFYEDRCVFAGNKHNPQSLHFSKFSDFKTFSSSVEEYSDKDLKSPFSVRLSGTARQTIQWVYPFDSGLLIGTNSSLWFLSSLSEREETSQSTVFLRCVSGVSTASPPPVMVGTQCVFVQGSQQSLFSMQSDRKWRYQFTDLNVLAEHMNIGGIKEFDFQASPYSILWIVRRDGALIGCTYDPENDICAWHSHYCGGEKTTILSLTCAPNNLGGQDECWLLVSRKGFDGKIRTSLETFGRFKRMNTYQPRDMIDGLSARDMV